MILLFALLFYISEIVPSGGVLKTVDKIVNTKTKRCQNEGRNLYLASVELVFSCSVQFSSVAQSCPTLCDPMNRSTSGLPVHHQLPEFTQTHVHRVRDAIQPSHPLSNFPIIRVFSNESVLPIRWPKYWRFSISPSNEYLGLISLQIR